MPPLIETCPQCGDENRVPAQSASRETGETATTLPTDAPSPQTKEVEEDQELDYPAIMRAMVKTGYMGLVAQEFIPTRDPMLSLREAVALCDV